ncbi:heavy metal translocating P-type ATPase [Pigmentiphaga aceris]|nr:heavy metal translocating P-type ATPase [Pigmentiphaga aceris]
MPTSRRANRSKSPNTPLPPGTTRTSYQIEQMDCPTEEALLRKVLLPMPGVHGLDVDLLERRLHIAHTLPDTQPLIQAIRGTGMVPVPFGDTATVEDKPPATGLAARIGPHARMAVAGVLAAGAEGLALYSGQDTSLPVVALALSAIALGGRQTLFKGWIALRHLTLNIHLLMALAVIGAALIGRWPEAAMVIWLFGLAELIEARSLDRARDAIRALTALAPDTAQVEQANGDWVAVPAAQVKTGDRVRARAGERIALDGTVETGHSAVDQSPITGESLPVDKSPGDTVFAGTVNTHGTLDYRVTALASDSTLARIARAVQEGQAQRAPTQRFVDVFSRYYTPAVIAAAVLFALLAPPLAGMAWREALYQALVLLVVACPCALVISTPVTVVSGLAAAARMGVLVKGGLYLEQGRKLRRLAFDKTGTLTHGRPALRDIVPLNGQTPDAMLRLAASLNALSTHPLAHAIVQAYADRNNQDSVEIAADGLPQTAKVSRAPAANDGVSNVDSPNGYGAKPHATNTATDSTAPLPVDNFIAVPGQGVRGRIDGQDYALGNARLIGSLLDEPTRARMKVIEQAGQTAIVLADDNKPLAIFAVADTVRPDAIRAIADLRALGIEVSMLSGDSPTVAAAVARELGVSDARGGLLPQDKLDAIAGWTAQGKVGMVGDGVNDAPALARADIGFAMGAAGSAAALETADVALLGDELEKLPRFIELSRRTSRILVQNITFALGTKALVFGLALAGHGSLWLAVFADTGASLLVVLNGLRLRGVRKSATPS